MSLSMCIKGKDYVANKQKYPKYSFNVNFAKNFNPDNYYVYFFEFNEKISMMKFEPDEVFVKALNEKIINSLNFENNFKREENIND